MLKSISQRLNLKLDWAQAGLSASRLSLPLAGILYYQQPHCYDTSLRFIFSCEFQVFQL